MDAFGFSISTASLRALSEAIHLWISKKEIWEKNLFPFPVTKLDCFAKRSQ